MFWPFKGVVGWLIELWCLSNPSNYAVPMTVEAINVRMHFLKGRSSVKGTEESTLRFLWCSFDAPCSEWSKIDLYSEETRNPFSELRIQSWIFVKKVCKPEICWHYSGCLVKMTTVCSCLHVWAKLYPCLADSYSVVRIEWSFVIVMPQKVFFVYFSVFFTSKKQKIRTP